MSHPRKHLPQPVSFFFAEHWWTLAEHWWTHFFQPKKPRKNASKVQKPKSPAEKAARTKQVKAAYDRKQVDKQHNLDPLKDVYPKLTEPTYGYIVELYGSGGIRSLNPTKYRAGAFFRAMDANQQLQWIDSFAEKWYLKLCMYEYRGFTETAGMWSNMKRILMVYRCLRDNRKNTDPGLSWMTAKNCLHVVIHAFMVIMDKLYSQSVVSRLQCGPERDELSKAHPMLHGNFFALT